MNKDKQNNQTENEEDKEIKYAIRSMESDLKNSGYKKGSFLKNEDAYSQQENQKAEEEERRKAQQKRIRERQEEERRNKENRPSPFLENIKKDEKNIFTNTEDEKEEKKQPSKNPKQKPSSLQKTTMEQENPQKTPFLFLGILIAVSLITAGSGFYYYFFVLNQEEEPKETVVKQQPQEPQEPTDKEEMEEEEEKEEEPIKQEERVLPNKLSDPDEIITLSRDETLIEKIQSIQNINQEPKVYQFKNKEEFIEAEDFLSALSIRINQEDIINSLDSAWLIMHKTEENKTRSAVVFEMEAENKESIQATLKEGETLLPEIFNPLHQEINQISVSEAENPEFKASKVNENFRYFNFTPNDETVSIDWGILNDNLLAISTSKPTTEAVVEIANQENLSENKKLSPEEEDEDASPEQSNQETDQ